MDKITEIIPDDLPEWAIKAMAEGQFFNVAISKVSELQNLAELKDDKQLRADICPSCVKKMIANGEME